MVTFTYQLDVGFGVGGVKVQGLEFKVQDLGLGAGRRKAVHALQAVSRRVQVAKALSYALVRIFA